MLTPPCSLGTPSRQSLRRGDTPSVKIGCGSRVDGGVVTLFVYFGLPSSHSCWTRSVSSHLTSPNPLWRAVRVFVWGLALGMLTLALAGGAHGAGAAPVHPSWIERYQTYAHGRCHDYGLAPLRSEVRGPSGTRVRYRADAAQVVGDEVAPSIFASCCAETPHAPAVPLRASIEFRRLPGDPDTSRRLMPIVSELFELAMPYHYDAPGRLEVRAALDVAHGWSVRVRRDAWAWGHQAPYRVELDQAILLAMLGPLESFRIALEATEPRGRLSASAAFRSGEGAASLLAACAPSGPSPAGVAR